MRHLTAITVAGLLAFAPALAYAKDKKKPAPAPAPTAAPASVVAPPAAAATTEEKVAAAKKRILAGIITADVGIAAIVAGIVLLSVGAAAEAPRTDAGLRRQLDTSGGVLLAFGAIAGLVGTLVWFDGRYDVKTARAAQKPSAMLLPAFSPTSAGAVVQVRF